MTVRTSARNVLQKSARFTMLTVQSSSGPTYAVAAVGAANVIVKAKVKASAPCEFDHRASSAW